MTIRNFSDHAANERTFLAWVRTSIAVTAFGFLVERFDLYLAVMMPSVLQQKIAVPRSHFGEVAGLVLLLAGVVMIVVAAIRFLRTAKQIDDQTVWPGTGSRVDIALAVLLALLGAALFLYLAHVIGSRS